MSIINQVLKDIDRRSQDDAKGVRRRTTYSGRPRRMRIWLWVLLGVICALLVVAAIYFVKEGSDNGPPLSAADDMVVQFTPPQLPARSNAEQTNTDQAQPASRRQQRADVRVIEQPQIEQPQIEQPATTSDNDGRVQGDESPEASNRESGANEQRATQDRSEETNTGNAGTTESDEPQRDANVQTNQQTAVETAEPANEFSIQRSEPSGRSQAEGLYEQALSDLDAGNARRAAQALHQVLLLEPAHVEAREELAAYYFGRGFVSDALEVLQGGVALVPDANSLLLLQARILERVEQQTQALDVIRSVEVTLPEDADLLILRGALATELDEYLLAAQSYEKLVAWRPDQGRWWIGLALAREKLNERELALQAYRRALQDGGLNQSTREFVHNRMEALSF